ncbi:MAG: hypothetical protein JNM84_22935, partial [Planctomycetes bacterium]|nr:hypothetical protein [Planctomycetota bacterium]
MSRSRSLRPGLCRAWIARAIAALSLAAASQAQGQPYLVRDLDTGVAYEAAYGAATEALTVGSITFAVFTQPEQGREL